MIAESGSKSWDGFQGSALPNAARFTPQTIRYAHARQLCVAGARFWVNLVIELGIRWPYCYYSFFFLKGRLHEERKGLGGVGRG